MPFYIFKLDDDLHAGYQGRTAGTALIRKRKEGEYLYDMIQKGTGYVAHPCPFIYIIAIVPAADCPTFLTSVPSLLSYT